MTIKSSGSSLAISEIAAEFGGSTPHSMSEYYRGGSNVPSASSTSGIAASGAITMSSFYGTANRVPITLTISSNTTNYNIYNNRGGTYAAGLSDVTLVNNATISSTSTGTAAVDTGTGWTSGDVITIDNNSTIVGDGGNGGAGGGNSAGAAGGAAGHAVNLQFNTTIDNTGGTLSGGGGGGGGGASAFGSAAFKSGTIEGCGGGGGGGGGQGGGAGGAGGSATGATNSNVAGSAGAAGSISAAGAGGAGGNFSTGTLTGSASSGGSGGTVGAAGTSTGGAGGAAGKAVNLNGNTVTFTATGTRNGATS